MLDIYRFILNHAWVSVLLPVAVILVRIRNTNPSIATLCAYILIGAVTELIVFIIKDSVTNNLPILHVYTYLEFFLLLLFFHFILLTRKYKKWWLIILGFYTILTLYFTLKIQGIYEFNSYIRAIEALILISLSLIWFNQTLTELKIKHLEKESNFWFVTAIFIYFSSSFFLFIFSNYLVKYSQKASLEMWVLHAIFNLVLNVLFAVGLWQHKKK